MIRVEGLTKTFGGFDAVSDLTFEVAEGEIFGFIGPNGAGKTTTIRILATLEEPTRGRASILDLDVTEEPHKVRDVMGFMPDVWGVYPGLTVAEYLEFFAASYGISRAERARAVGEAMELTDLHGLRAKLVETLSKGMKQRLCLAKTLIHDPRLLILDEPANGLDPRARIELRALLRELASMGKTILISSHILTELSDLVTSVGIIERGRMLMAGPVDAVVDRLEAESAAGEASGEGSAGGLRRFVLRTQAARAEAAREALLARPEVRSAAVRDEREVTFAFPGAEDDVAPLVAALVAAEVPVLGLREERANLESVFMAVTRGDVQ